MADMRNLNILRGAVKRRITGIKKFIDQVDINEDPEKAIFMLEYKLPLIDECVLHYVAVYEEMKNVASSAEDEECAIKIEDDYTTFIDNVIEIKYAFKKHMDSFHRLLNPVVDNSLANKPTPDVEIVVPQQGERNNSDQDVNSAPQPDTSVIGLDPEIKPLFDDNIQTRHAHNFVKLPRISLPEFDGDMEKWLGFRDSFRDIIIENPSITNIQRYHYLVGVLKGDARRAIANIEFSSTGFQQAWDALNSKYDDKKAILDNHFRLFFNMRPMNKESKEEISRIVDDSQKHLRALEKLGERLSDAVAIFTIKLKFDTETRKLWENEDSSNAIPMWSEMLDFLYRRCRSLSALSDGSSKNINKKNSSSFFASSEGGNNQDSCPVCNNKSHAIASCREFLSMTPEKRLELIKQFNLCINCFKKGHRVFQCRAPRCKTCKRRHHSLLHRNQVNDTKNEEDKSSAPTSTPTQSTAPTSSVNLLCNKPSNSQVLLSTIQVSVQGHDGNYHQCRALLDSASQSSFMSSDIADKLQLNEENVTVAINGLNQLKTDISRKVSTNIKSRLNDFTLQTEFYVIHRITNRLPNQYIDCSDWKIPPYIKLADKNFNVPDKIDLLLGADVFFNILQTGQFTFPNQNQPVFQETVFGWIVAGRVDQQAYSFFLESQNELQLDDVKLDEAIQKFWKIESIESDLVMTPEMKSCEQIFADTFRRNESGRFVVDLPLKPNVTSLGDSKSLSIKRFHYIERKLQNRPELKIQYVDFMREYERLGHMRICHQTNEETQQNFLPHHAVLKPTSTTTKLRVVFDASAKTSSGLSLNDVLMVGPTVQNDLMTIILQFRKFRYVFTADVEKMYRQILVNENHTPLQKIVWRENPDEMLREYELLTVTYGTSCAPYLATKTLQQLALSDQERLPLASKTILDNFYVDDMLAGSDTIEDSLKLQAELVTIFDESGMKLRKWSSNTSKLLDAIPIKDRENLEETNDTIKTLGLVWNAKNDYFKFITSPIDRDTVTTKRILLSDIAKLFDPLGLVAPIIVTAKVLMQRVWISKIEWDEPLPPELQLIWDAYRQELESINSIQIPRSISSHSSSINIHGFADASSIAYGACVYARSIGPDGEVVVRLISSKSRVAPLATTSIPRLELNAAVLLANLVKKVIAALKIDDKNCILWSDSSIVLSWLKLPPHQMKTYVANRVSEIQEMTSKMTWRHVDTKNNAADVLSRGLLPAELLECQDWFNGPTFLTQNEENWPNKFILSSSVPEMKEKSSSFVIVKHNQMKQVIEYERYSFLSRVVRIVAWCRRFFYNLTSKGTHRSCKTLQSDELNEATTCLLKCVQNELFNEEINVLSANKQLDSKNSLIRLTPFVDSLGILRVGGRLEHCNALTSDQKHQILLRSHHITNLLIRETHESNLHAGIQQTMATIRQQYWIVNGKRIVKSVIHACVSCARLNPKTLYQLMGNLPSDRFDSLRPFEKTGLDFCGPFSVRYKNQRKETYAKVYICIFVCMTCKAVHLEICEDATADTFIACLKRFISRRGKPITIWSDNGLNFVGAHNILTHLKEMFERENEKIINFCSPLGVQWKFIPPRSPHFGGIWESGVKVIKTHLKKKVGNRIMTLEFLYTVVVQIEGIMNSRPLSELSSDPNDLQPLTPGHFLIGCPINAFPEPNVSQIPANRLTQWQQITQMIQLYWRRFNLEYLNTLQQRSKWVKQHDNIKVNELVLVKDENLPTTHWLTGRIVEIIKGADGLVRCVIIRTKNGNIKRAITNVARLPVEITPHE